jgi:hypothetical protein
MMMLPNWSPSITAVGDANVPLALAKDTFDDPL